MSFIKSIYKNGVRLIVINRPERKNAMCNEMYQTVREILNKDASDNKTCVTIITGEGEYFSSGNDIKSAFENTSQTVEERTETTKAMITSFINYPKLIIAVVNGPAIGIGATMAALCDIVYASNTATFDTPFVKLGLCAEGTSSFTFPFILGKSKASELLYLNHKMTAAEALQFGFISKIVPQNEIQSFIEDLHKYGKLPVESVINNKRLVMANFKDILSECNTREINQLRECVNSESFLNAVMEFLNKKKSKL